MILRAHFKSKKIWQINQRKKESAYMVSNEQRIIGQNMNVVDRMIATIRGGGRRKAGHLESPILCVKNV